MKIVIKNKIYSEIFFGMDKAFLLDQEYQFFFYCVQISMIDKATIWKN